MKIIPEVLKQALYSYKISSKKTVNEQLDKFDKLILDFENIDFHIDDGDQVLLLLCSLLKTHYHFKGTLLYGRDSLSRKFR